MYHVLHFDCYALLICFWRERKDASFFNLRSFGWQGPKEGEGVSRKPFHDCQLFCNQGVPESPKSKVLMMSACIYPPSSKYTKRLLGRMAAPWAMAASPRLRGGLRVATQVATLQERCVQWRATMVPGGSAEVSGTTRCFCIGSRRLAHSLTAAMGTWVHVDGLGGLCYSIPTFATRYEVLQRVELACCSGLLAPLPAACVCVSHKRCVRARAHFRVPPSIGCMPLLNRRSLPGTPPAPFRPHLAFTIYCAMTSGVGRIGSASAVGVGPLPGPGLGLGLGLGLGRCLVFGLTLFVFAGEL